MITRSAALASLRHRNFRLYFSGQLVSMVGTWMQTTAQAWLVYRLAGSGSYLGYVAAAGQGPSLLLGLFGGSVADRWDRRKVLIATQTAALLQAVVFATLSTVGVVRVRHVLVLAAVLGVINVFDMPARQAFVAELVPREEMGNAIALSGILLNLSRLIGPAAAGLCIAKLGESGCFWLNAFSFLAVLASLLMIRPKKDASPRVPTVGEWARIRDGMKYAFGDPRRRAILILLTAVSLTGVPFFTLLPAYTEGLLHAGPGGLGGYTSVFAVGALVASYLLARNSSVRDDSRMVGIAAIVFGVGIASLALARVPSAVCAALVLTGWGMMTSFSGANIRLQSLSDDTMRGRVMGFFSMTFMAAAPLGSLLAGWACDRWGVSATLAGSGLLCACAGFIFAARVICETGWRVPQPVKA